MSRAPTARSQSRWPPFQVVPFGSDFIVRCAECGELQQVLSEAEGRDVGRDHQRWEHPTEDEAAQDQLRAFECGEVMEGFCTRCGHEGHASAACPTVTPDLLKNGGKRG